MYISRTHLSIKWRRRRRQRQHLLQLDFSQKPFIIELSSRPPCVLFGKACLAAALDEDGVDFTSRFFFWSSPMGRTDVATVHKDYDEALYVVAGFEKTRATWCILTTRMEIGFPTVAPGSHCMHTKDDNDDAKLRNPDCRTDIFLHYDLLWCMIRQTFQLRRQTSIECYARSIIACTRLEQLGLRLTKDTTTAAQKQGHRCRVASPTPWLMRTLAGMHRAVLRLLLPYGQTMKRTVNQCKTSWFAKERMHVGDGSAMWCPNLVTFGINFMFANFKKLSIDEMGFCTNYQGSITNRLQSTT